MAGLPELAAKIGADKASVEAVAGPINSSKGQAEHVLTALSGLGIEQSSARMRGVIDQIEEAESIRESLHGALVKAQFIVLSAIHGTMGPGAKSAGQGGNTPSPISSTSSDLRPRSAAGFGHRDHDDQVDFSIRVLSDEQAERIANGFPLVPEEIDPNDDRLASRPVRAVRVAARGIEDLHGGSKQTTKDIFNFKKFFDPPANNAYTETVPKDSGPQFTAPPAAPGVDPAEAFANAVVLSVAAAKVAVGDMRRRRQG